MTGGEVARYAALIDCAVTGRELHGIAAEVAAAGLPAADVADLQARFHDRARHLWPGVLRVRSASLDAAARTSNRRNARP